MSDEWLSTGECAVRKGVSRQAITAAIARGVLPARKVGRNYVVTQSDCDAYEALKDPVARGRRGGPKTEKRGRGRPRKTPPAPEERPAP